MSCSPDRRWLGGNRVRDRIEVQVEDARRVMVALFGALSPALHIAAPARAVMGASSTVIAPGLDVLVVAPGKIGSLRMGTSTTNARKRG